MLPEKSTRFFPLATPINLQDTYINDKHLESALLYKYGESEAGQE